MDMKGNPLTGGRDKSSSCSRLRHLNLTDYDYAWMLTVSGGSAVIARIEK